MHLGRLSQYPPLYPILLAVIFPFGVTLLYVKLFTVIISSLTLIPTYLIGKELYDKRKAVISALLMFALPYAFLMSLQGMNDILMTLFSALFLYFFILYFKNGQGRYGILTGVIVGIGLLFKYTIGIFFLSTFLFAIFYDLKNENRAISKTLLVIFISLLFIIPWIIFMYYLGLVNVQIDKLIDLSQPGRRSGSYFISGFYWWFLFVAESFLVLSPTNSILLILLIVHVVDKRKFEWKNILLLSWVIVPFIFFGVLQPLIRYWMISFPALTLLIANSIEDLNREQYRGKIFFTTLVCSLVLCFLISYISLIFASEFLVSHSIGDLWKSFF
jgi:4-amino-4-deoxy-L-arabinose transferase-like glycosyltransferase